MQVVLGVVAIVLMFLLLIAPHEGGHFLFAKLFRVRVIEFAIGMGPRIWGRGEAPASAALEGAGAPAVPAGPTVYSWRLLPIAGYVRLGGMEPGDLDGPDGFHSKPAYQRLLILFGGPLVNFVVAALIATTVYLMVMNPFPGKIGAVLPNTPASAAGLRVGDVITEVDGQPVSRPETIRDAEARSKNSPLQLTVKRPDGTTFQATVTPAYDAQYKAYLMGIRTQGTLATLGGQPVMTPLDAIEGGVLFPVQAVQVIWQGLYQLVTGQIPGGVFGPQGATGPIGIGAITYSAANEGILSWLYVAALLSVALGSANLLPLPALDGGRMVVVLLEKLRGRPFDRERELAFQRAGLVALLALMGVIAYFDIQRLVTGQFPGLK